jgi:RNA polymerase sigma-70 factor (ECF subfamily)
MHSATDDELMLEVRGGNLRKLGVLFERYQTPLFNFSFRLTGDRAASEDLVQEVFFRILRFRHTFQEDSSFVTWMYRIARNARIDGYRKSKREVGLEPDEEIPARQPSVAQNLEAEQETALLRQALAKLPEEKRELLILTRFQGMKYDQIAELYGVQAGTLKTRVFRALGELREIYFKLRGGVAAVG